MISVCNIGIESIVLNDLQRRKRGAYEEDASSHSMATRQPQDTMSLASAQLDQ